MKISDRLWDFIEANVPDYGSREDVELQSRLQLFIDKHGTAISGQPVADASKLRNLIIYRLCFEAIEAFTLSLPVAITGKESLYGYAQMIAQMAYMAGREGFRPSCDSSETFSQIITWANEFYSMYSDGDWIGKDYPDTLDTFVQEKLSKTGNVDNIEQDFPIAFIDRSALKKHGYLTDDLSDGDMREIAGIMGDFYCGSEKYDIDMHEACAEYGIDKSRFVPNAVVSG